jgi:hypothetical protein
MTDAQIARKRLHDQSLSSPASGGVAEIVRRLGAVQAQDYPNAKWAVGQRGKGITDADVERSFNAGEIIRTHLLRPTWHFVAAEDLRWLLKLTAPRVSAAMASYNRVLELDQKQFRKSNGALARALRDGEHLTRAQLSKALGRAGVNVSTGQRVGHLLMQAELDGVICSGPRDGRQVTYALLDARVPPRAGRDRDESLLDLTLRYFGTRGPATLQDFSWWSGLVMADAKRGVDLAAKTLQGALRDGRRLWFAAEQGGRIRGVHAAHLLPNYDEYFVGLKDRSAISARLRKSVTKPRVDALNGHVVVVDGQIVGGWRRSVGKTIDLQLELLVALTSAERKLVTKAAERLAQFLGLPVKVSGFPSEETT